ncbi:MAG: DUF502 domain-containing protein [Planctomycetota bacterium]
MARDQHTFWGDFRTFFVRGLAVLLPSIVTLWLLFQAFTFLFANVAEPINRGIRLGIVEIAPRVTPERFQPSWLVISDDDRATFRATTDNLLMRDASDSAVSHELRRQKLREIWQNWGFGVLDLSGLFVAIVLLYLAGRLLGSFVGRWFYARLEGLLRAIPGFKQVYPHVKQVVDLIMGDSKMAFSRVVLVEYPRKGIWTVGLVTSSSLKPVADQANGEVLSVFIPTSPTPFTGFTINMPAADCVDVDMTIDQALRFVITAGVLVPEKHQMPAASGVPQLHVPNGEVVGPESADLGGEQAQPDRGTPRTPDTEARREST